LASYFETDILFRMKQVLAGNARMNQPVFQKTLIGRAVAFSNTTSLSSMKKRWQTASMKIAIYLLHLQKHLPRIRFYERREDAKSTGSRL